MDIKKLNEGLLGIKRVLLEAEELSLPSDIQKDTRLVHFVQDLMKNLTARDKNYLDTLSLKKTDLKYGYKHGKFLIGFKGGMMAGFPSRQGIIDHIAKNKEWYLNKVI